MNLSSGFVEPTKLVNANKIWTTQGAEKSSKGLEMICLHLAHPQFKKGNADTT